MNSILYRIFCRPATSSSDQTDWGDRNFGRSELHRADNASSEDCWFGLKNPSHLFLIYKGQARSMKHVFQKYFLEFYFYNKFSISCIKMYTKDKKKHHVNCTIDTKHTRHLQCKKNLYIYKMQCNFQYKKNEIKKQGKMRICKNKATSSPGLTTWAAMKPAAASSQLLLIPHVT